MTGSPQTPHPFDGGTTSKGEYWRTVFTRRCPHDLDDTFPCHLRADAPHTEHEAWSAEHHLLVWKDSP